MPVIRYSVAAMQYKGRQHITFPTLLACVCRCALAGDVLAQVAVPAPTVAAIALSHKLDLYWIAEKILALAIPCLFSTTSGTLSCPTRSGARMER
jgi:hypothetical protein